MNIGVHPDHWKQISMILSRPELPIRKKYGFFHSPPVSTILNSSIYKYPKLGRSVRLFLKLPQETLRPLLWNRCYSCHSIHIGINHQLGELVCFSCGYVIDDRIVESSSYQQSAGGAPYAKNLRPVLPRKLSHNVGKRLNHFKYWLNRLQGKELCKVTETEYKLIQEELNRYPYTPITPEKIRFVLKRLKLTRYFNNTFSILKRLTGNALLEFDTEHEQMLIQFFLQIQDCFGDAAKGRANMMSYLYLIKKMSELLGWNDIAEEIPLLKSKFKTRELDKIWQRICHHHNLNFIKSV